MKLILNLIFFLHILINILFSYQSTIDPIKNKKYFETIYKTLQHSQKTIHIVMYYINLVDTERKTKVLTLVDELVKAHKRGVEVKVILDNTMPFTNSFTIGDPKREDTKNKIAFEYLKDNGVEVHYDDVRIYTHAKCIIIDNKIVIMGSTNWSESAFTNNFEVSALIKSKEYAEALLSDINKITLNENITIEKQEYLTLSLDRMNTLERMLEKRSKLAWDLYFYLLLNYELDKEIEIDYNKAINNLEINKKFKESKKRYYIRRSLLALDKEYNAIRYINSEDTINNPKIIISKTTNDNMNIFEIPKRFWEYNWHKRLSLLDQYCYFINCIEGTQHLKAWSLSLDTISKKYSLYKKSITQGMSTLRHWNLLKIRYGRTKQGNYKTRFPNMYRLNKLYRMKEWKEKLEELKKEYGREKVVQARTYAKIVYCEKDLYEIENILKWIEQYGEDKVSDAFNIVKSYKSKSTSLKSMRYVKGILNNN